MQRFGIVLASVREGRRGEAFARWIGALASARPDLETTLLDLKEWPLPPYTQPSLPIHSESKYAPGSLEARWAEQVRGLDGFIVVTPEYNRGYPGQLKSALDTLYSAWNYKPVAFVSYGGWAAGARSVEQLSLVAIELKMVVVRESLHIRLIGLQVDDAGAPTDPLYTKRAGALLDELLWWSPVLKSARASRPT